MALIRMDETVVPPDFVTVIGIYAQMFYMNRRMSIPDIRSIIRNDARTYSDL